MKTALVLAAVLISSMAVAAPKKMFINGPNNGANQPQPQPQPQPPGPLPSPEPPVEIKPIRMAKIHAVIQKFNFTPNAGGVVVNPQTDVCTVDGDVPVFELRNLPPVQSGSFYTYGHLSCPSVLGGKAVNVDLNSAIALSTSGPKNLDQKSFQVSLYVRESANLPYDSRYSSGSSAFSRDLNLNSIGFYLTPDIRWTCPAPQNPTDPTPPCRSDITEYFTADVEITD